jgi:putative lipoic acid-binding regulatory protein
MAPPDGPPAGSFFHQVPDDDEDDDELEVNDGIYEDEIVENLLDNLAVENEVVSEQQQQQDDDSIAMGDFDDAVSKLIRQRRKKPRASQPSTINGVPTKGFSKAKATNTKKGGNKASSSKPFVAIGPTGVTIPEPINDPSRPQVDDQGYTLYTNEETGEKSRVFEALVDYPCVFTMKIVGANEGTFVEDILAVVADATESEMSDLSHSTKAMGKWTSVTVQAPVQSSEMLYTLYEKVDLDPRVKFKF